MIGEDEKTFPSSESNTKKEDYIWISSWMLVPVPGYPSVQGVKVSLRKSALWVVRMNEIYIFFRHL